VTAQVELPEGVLEFTTRGPAWAEFVHRLPRLVAELVEEWELSVDGVPTHGYCALVLPVRTAAGLPAMLKLSFPDDESEHEHLALQHWQGNGAVKLLRADPHRYAMLLERLHREDLNRLGDLEACEVTAGFYARLHVPALPQLRTLSSYIARWTADLTRLDPSAPLPRRLVEQALALGTDFVADPQTNGAIIHGDLHYENVLAADREPWLVIDPKPMSGDPHYEVAPLLWNRWDEILGSPNPRDAVRRRFHTVIDTAGLDEERARDWVVVRMIHNAMWCLEDNPDGFDAEEQAYLTMCISLAKAVQN
jgi:streptomycin 6-kinase